MLLFNQMYKIVAPHSHVTIIQDNIEYEEQIPFLFVDGADPRDLVQGKVFLHFLRYSLRLYTIIK